MMNNIESTTDRKPQQPLFAIPVVNISYLIIIISVICLKNQELKKS